jgi:hypothetical protein
MAIGRSQLLPRSGRSWRQSLLLPDRTFETLEAVSSEIGLISEALELSTDFVESSGLEKDGPREQIFSLAGVITVLRSARERPPLLGFGVRL